MEPPTAGRARHRHFGFHTCSCGGPASQQPTCCPFSPPGTLHILTFWKEDPVGWFHYAEAEFVVASIPIHSYLCYSHVLRSLQPDVITTVRDLVCTVMLDTLSVYDYLKHALLSRYTSTAIAKCFRFIDHPDLGDRHPLTLFSDMQALLPEDANILFNAIIYAACRNPCRTLWQAKASFPLLSSLKPPPFCPAHS